MTSASPSPSQRVRDQVEIGDRQRRRRDAGLVMVRIAPIGAAVVLALAWVVRLAGWPAALPVAAWIGLAAALLAIGARARRVESSTDGIAARLDADARLAGELRSAHWFASSPSPDAWTRFHLERAADRAHDVHWVQVYPPVPARRAWLTATALSFGALAVLLAMPRVSASPTPARGLEAAAPAVLLEDLPPDLQQHLRDLMTLVQHGDISADAATLELNESATFASLDSTKRQQLTKELKRIALNRSADPAAQVLIPPGQAADDQRWARDNQSTRQASQQAQQEGTKTDSGAQGTESKTQHGAADDSAAGDKGAASDAKARAVQPDVPHGAGEAAAMRITGNGPTSGEPGTGYGGQHGDATARRVDAEQIAASLVREVVDANMNAASSGQKTDDDRRRSTEQSHSALAYTRATARSDYDRAHADAPRVVPEARRALLERYFVRSEAPR